MKANYVGAYGPRVPSFVGPIILIGIGVIALLLVTGHIAAGEFWAWYGHWWPLLLIGAGLPAGRVGAGSAPGGSGAPRRQLCRPAHLAGHSGICRRRMESCAAVV
jgi:hypothetical protein